MNLRLQTVNETGDKVINDGLKSLSLICDIIEEKFTKALEKKWNNIYLFLISNKPYWILHIIDQFLYLQDF